METETEMKMTETAITPSDFMVSWGQDGDENISYIHDGVAAARNVARNLSLMQQCRAFVYYVERNKAGQSVEVYPMSLFVNGARTEIYENE